MDDKIITLRNIWKVGIIALAFSAIAAFTLIFYTKGVLASCDSHDYSYQESEEDNGHEDWDCEEEDEPSPTPQPQGGQDQGQSQEQNQDVNVDVDVKQNQENNQTVNITVPEVKAAVTNVPAKQPETGVGVLGMASVAGAGPLGLLLARYGRGRIVTKKEDNLAQEAFGLVQKRQGKDSDA